MTCIPQLVGLRRSERRAMLRQLERDNAARPERLTIVPETRWRPVDWDPTKGTRLLVWESKYFMVQAFREPGNIVRLSINRTSVDNATLRWRDGITWDELQQVKRECGYGDFEAIEIYPPDADLIDVGNLRHLWILPDRLPCSWKREL